MALLFLGLWEIEKFHFQFSGVKTVRERYKVLRAMASQLMFFFILGCLLIDLCRTSFLGKYHINAMYTSRIS